MGCKRLTYSDFGTSLKVVHRDFSMIPKSCAGSYRYGFQAQEKDDEVKGAGNSVNYTYRMHDPRLGRFFAIDPLTKEYPHYTPYSFSGNKVIHAIELEGKEELVVSNILPSSRPAIFVNNDSELQNQIMFVLPGATLGIATTITRPVTAAEQRSYGSFLNRNGSKGMSPDVSPARNGADANGQFIAQTRDLGSNTGNTPNAGTSPPNTTQTNITNDFGATPVPVQTVNFQIANGATSLDIIYSAGASFPNNFVFTDGVTGSVLSPPGGYNGIGSTTLSIPAGVTNVNVNVTGTPSQLFDTWQVSVSSSGPTTAATSVTGVSINTPARVNGLSQTTTPITVNTGVTSTPTNPINQ